jgi:hypothetical protein
MKIADFVTPAALTFFEISANVPWITNSSGHEAW